jgi:hypothetical protein
MCADIDSSIKETMMHLYLFLGGTRTYLIISMICRGLIERNNYIKIVLV